eukprot:TRINITY_DN10157_c0_g1_i2.p1 TRINITY_DN10157_c0_g1~~TRINITY_DN10157_c0_g1_i2.p1  ORF type:complete len:493 (-),score=96.69 TRINITY_DN10157_c0_g1_i2:145-1623(-)
MPHQWRRSVPPCPTASVTDATVEAWKEHPRLQKHLQRYRQNSNRAKVLQTYFLQVTKFDSEQQLRAAVHVAAWVALLPIQEATAIPESDANDGITQLFSPAQLLAYILRLRKTRTKMTDWLIGVLHLVALRLKELRFHPEVKDEEQRHWIELRRSMPKSIWRALRSQTPHIPGSVQAEAAAEPLWKQLSTELFEMDAHGPPSKEKKLELKSNCGNEIGTFDLLPDTVEVSDNDLKGFHKYAVRASRRFAMTATAFTNSSFDERVCKVQMLELEVEKAINEESWSQLCVLLRDATAALAKPCLKTCIATCSAEQSAEAAQQLLQGDLQIRLRKIVCKSLLLLDLTDEGTVSLLQPALSYLRNLIWNFEQTHQQTIAATRSGKQWVSLKSLVGNDSEDHIGKSLGEVADPALMSDLAAKAGAEDAKQRQGVKQLKKRTRQAPYPKSETVGVYNPNLKIRALSHVKQNMVDVIVACSKCSAQLTSCWVFERPLHV